MVLEEVPDQEVLDLCDQLNQEPHLSEQLLLLQLFLTPNQLVLAMLLLLNLNH